MPTGEIDDRLTRLRVLRLGDTAGAEALEHRWLYYKGQQNDHLSFDWEGHPRTAGMTYVDQRRRILGPAPNPNTGGAGIPFGQRRPHCPTTICGQVVDTYTALLLGEGRQPSVRTVGDQDGTELLEALLEHSESWDSLVEARTISGAEGAVAVVPEVIMGEPALRVLRPEHCYVEWTERRDWVPKLVIEQKLVEVDDIDEASGRVIKRAVWRTRAWDETFAYVYQDVVQRGSESDEADEKISREDDIELAAPPIEHQAGRCPVVWIQNTRNSEGPYGEPDCEPVYEQIDQLDKLQSMLARGARANVDPTLYVKDRISYLRRWPTRTKGYGQLLQTSEAGDVKLIEIAGKSFEVSWATFDRVKRQIDLRTGVVTIDAENAGAYQSGVALQLLWRTQNTRAGARRQPLGKAIVQLCGVWLELVRAHGIKSIGSEGEGIELPLREQAEDESGWTVPADGASVAINWPSYHEATPQDLDTTARALSMLTGGKQVLSQESAVAVAVNLTQADTDVATELERINEEGAAKIAAFDDAMRPDVDGLGGLDTEAPAGAESVQELALNGAQTKALFDALARVNKDLAPGAVRIGIRNAFPAIDDDEAGQMITEQTKFVAETESAGHPTPPPHSPGVPRPAPPEQTGELELEDEEDV